MLKHLPNRLAQHASWVHEINFEGILGTILNKPKPTE